MVYLVNDLLHHSAGQKSSIASSLKQHLKAIFTTASDVNLKRDKSIPRQLNVVLDSWTRHRFYSETFLEKLRTIVDSGGQAEVSVSDDEVEIAAAPERQKVQVSAMPAVHGDESEMWFRQPAAVMLYEMARSPGRPIDPKRMKPLKFKQGPAPEKLQAVMKAFMDDVNKIGTSKDMDGGNVVDIDAMGRLSLKDPETGAVASNESYYGWSRDLVKTITHFRRKIRRRENGSDQPDLTIVKRWTIPRSPSPSMSPSPRRGSHSRSSARRTRSHSRSRGRQPNYSRSRTRSSSPSRQRRYTRSGSRSRSPSSSRNRSNYRSRSRSPRPYSPSRGRSSRDHGHDNSGQGPQGSSRPPYPQQQQQQQQQHQHQGYGRPPAYPNPGIPSSSPPRPPNWQGPWPPPPPPPGMLPGQMPPFPPNMPPFPPPIAPGQMPPFPPPPFAGGPPPMPQQYQQRGRYGGNNAGRGGYGGGYHSRR